MLKFIKKFAIRCFLFTLCSTVQAKDIQNYVYFELERERISEDSFLNTPQLVGAQLKYTWDELEVGKGVYNFDQIEKDLNYLTGKKKKLFIQIQDLTFNLRKKYVPAYLLAESEYNGGVGLHYLGEGEDAKPEGWIARRWDISVSGRFQKLLKELGKKFDGRIAGINLPETAFAYGDREDLKPKDFTPEKYKDAVIETMKVLKSAFPNSIAMQYTNFMPGEWLPHEDNGYMKDVYAAAKANSVAVGGPDLLPYKKGQMNHAYHFLPLVEGFVTTGIAAQEDNYKHINPRTGKQVTVPEMYTFAKEPLKIDIIFWCTQEPYYSRDVLPFLKAH